MVVPSSSAKEAFEYWILQLGGSAAEGYIEGGGVPVRITAEAETCQIQALSRLDLDGSLSHP
jgi:hypothetical protein